MLFSPHRSFFIEERSYASVLKREIKHIAEDIGFHGHRLSELEIILSEIISNLLKHATGLKEILVKPIRGTEGPGIEIMAIDDGPGMSDLSRMMQDGVSTSSTLGQGLGAVKRLSHEFDIYSLKNWGTILLSRLYLNFSQRYTRPAMLAEPRAVIVPKPNETDCGDGWIYKKIGDNYRIFAMDGLGHGSEAQKAIEEAKKAFINDNSRFPSDALIAMHDGLRKTRGMVASMADYDIQGKMLLCCGIGNINTRLVSINTNKVFVSYNGTLGMNRPAIMHNQKMEIRQSTVLIMASDGIKTRWDTLKYPGITMHDNSIIAAALYKDNVRRTDDAMVIAFSIK